MPLGLGKAAKAAAGLVKPVYEDLAQPAVRELGAFAGESVRAILLAIRKAVEQYSEVVERLSEKVAQKVRGIPADRLIEPPAHVAGPILEAVRFVPVDSPLHELYANLLARSMDASTARSAHPAFVSVVSQMTPDEARILHHIRDGRSLPTLTIDDLDDTASAEKGEFWDGVLRNFTLIGADAGCAAPELATAYVDNLVRLGVLEFQSEYQLADEAAYGRLESAAEVVAACAEIQKVEGHLARKVRSFFSVTDFGKLFIEATTQPPAP